MKKELELYVHIPFCIRKCAYCDFLSGPAREEIIQKYVNALQREIKSREESCKNTWQVSTIFFGGGTPSILHGFQIEAIFAALNQSFQIAENAEITIEVNPGTVTEEKLAAWKKAGINRLSIGLQSVNDKELQTLGRIHTYKEFLDTYQLARSYGFNNINIDLISAVPGQTKESWEKTITEVAELNPEHISAYSLIIEEGTPFYERFAEGNKKEGSLLMLPDEDEEREIYAVTEKILFRYGYERYEISNYAKSGFECRHNKGYWERKEYLGFGTGAASLIGHTRFTNITLLEQYIKKAGTGSEICEEISQLSIEEEIEEFMFLGLRIKKGISKNCFHQRFGIDIDRIYGTVIKKLEEKGLIVLSGDYISLTEKGIDVSNLVFVEFMWPDIKH